MFDNLIGLIWFDGEFIKWGDAKIHIMTHALHYASSVFEGIRAYNQKLFKGTQHYTRFLESAKYLSFQIPYTVEELLIATNELLNHTDYQNAYIRAISWCGSKKMTVSHNGADVHTAICAWERNINYPNTYYSHGISMNIARWKRPSPDTAPVRSKASGLYMISSISKKEAEILGFQDSLMLDFKSNIAEATSSNIFLVSNGVLYTPKPICCLNGITRKTCIEIAIALGIEVVEGDFSLDFLNKTQEVFLTGTAIEILPVGQIAGPTQIWNFTPSKITYDIIKEFQNIIQKL